jgi:pimeloyl-ACP methyl ester carboxylesterase
MAGAWWKRTRAFALRLTAVTALIGVIGWTGAVGWLWANEARFVFRAYRSRVISPVAYRDLINLNTVDGMRLDAVTLVADTPADYWILFCPPAAGTIHGRLQSQLEALRELGYNVFAFDYRGFGRNPGTPSETGLYDDALAAYRHLVDVRRVAPSHVILAGRSLGSAVAVELATRVPAAGLLLLSVLDSVPATAERLYPWAPVRLLASNRFDSLAKAGRVRVPVVLAHGLNDRLIPIEAARQLFERFPGPKVMLETYGGHNRAGLAEGDSLADALSRFWAIDGAARADDSE